MGYSVAFKPLKNCEIQPEIAKNTSLTSILAICPTIPTTFPRPRVVSKANTAKTPKTKLEGSRGNYNQTNRRNTALSEKRRQRPTLSRIVHMFHGCIWYMLSILWTYGMIWVLDQWIHQNLMNARILKSPKSASHEGRSSLVLPDEYTVASPLARL